MLNCNNRVIELMEKNPPMVTTAIDEKPTPKHADIGNSYRTGEIRPAAIGVLNDEPDHIQGTFEDKRGDVL